MPVQLDALPAQVDDTKARAIFRDGVLEITLPKVESAKRHTLKIEEARLHDIHAHGPAALAGLFCIENSCNAQIVVGCCIQIIARRLLDGRPGWCILFHA
jgi:hypothetical protein